MIRSIRLLLLKYLGFSGGSHFTPSHGGKKGYRCKLQIFNGALFPPYSVSSFLLRFVSNVF